MKRKNYISWDEYFMGVDILAAQRSKDPSTQVGACIVDASNRILSTGYNGFPYGCDDDDYSWERQGESLIDTKYPYVVHAELNAILNAHGTSLANSTIYVDLFPCNECAKAIIQCGIAEVVYLSDKYGEQDLYKASRKMLTSAGIKLRQMDGKGLKLILDFSKNM